jgi:hypothetical protein
MKPGSSSLQAPPRAPVDYVTHALVVFGILISSVFIAGSALLNFRMGFTSADNPTDGTIYGGLAATGDGLKALSPFVAGYAWRHRHWLATFAATIVFVTFTAYSFTSALGFSSQHRAVKEGNAITLMERHQDMRSQLRRDTAELDALGPQRSSGEISQAINNRFSAPIGSGRWTVDQVSEACTRNKPATREACAAIASLKEELARAREAERLSAEIHRLTETLSSNPVVETANPQADALAFLGRGLNLISEKDGTAREDKTVGFGLALLMAIFIELGSGLGLYISTTPWRASPPQPSPEPTIPAILEGPPIEAFVAECFERKSGHELELAFAFAAYVKWCEARGKPRLARGRFEHGLVKLAREIGLEDSNSSCGWVIMDVSLRKWRLRQLLLTARETKQLCR